MSGKIKDKKKWKKCLLSDSDSDSNNTISFTKIKKIYKCGICDKKIKNYCKCVNNVNTNTSSYPGSNIITIMTNPENEKQKEIVVHKGDKGDKGEKGLTGSMGSQGNSFVFFTSNNQVNSGEFIGVNVSSGNFDKASIIIPYDFYIKQIGFVIRNQLNSKCTITLYINNKPTDYVVCICDGISSFKSFNSILKIKPSDLLCFKIFYENGILSNGLVITLVIN
jgi:hypothetical protein